MHMNRRHFITLSALAAPVAGWAQKLKNTPQAGKPIVISTWAQNAKANAAAWDVLRNNGRALDAVEHGVMTAEADPNDQSVGYGGLPDRDGRVTCDAAIMDEHGNIGSVMCLEHIMHAISVARLVMEKTPHVQIVGAGALELALANGFKKVDMLTEKSRADWQEWLKTSNYNPMDTFSNMKAQFQDHHDTIGMVAMDAQGNLGGACTTSGMAFKMHGRVGDSPIIGAGLYVDNEIGAASATGVGEEVVRICGSHTVVEMMRQGKTPTQACIEAVRRLVKMRGEKKARELQIGFVALNKKGEYGCYSLTKDFTMAVQDAKGSRIIHAKYLL